MCKRCVRLEIDFDFFIDHIVQCSAQLSSAQHCHIISLHHGVDQHNIGSIADTDTLFDSIAHYSYIARTDRIMTSSSSSSSSSAQANGINQTAVSVHASSHADSKSSAQSQLPPPVVLPNKGRALDKFDGLTDSDLYILAQCRDNIDPLTACCRRALTWSELCMLVYSNNLHYLGRLESQQSFYRQSMNEMLSEFNSISDCVKHRRLGLKAVVDAKTKKLYCPSDAMSDSILTADEPLIRWCVNDFRYALTDDVQHCLIWSNRQLTSQQINQTLHQHVPSIDFDVLHFVNPVALQSIPDIHHVHVFARRKRNHSTSSDQR